MPAKILILDIETAPKVAYVWRFFKENVSPKQVKEHGHIMSFAAKWLGEEYVYYEENRKENDIALIKVLNSLLDQADIVVAHYGKKFDLPQISGRSVVHGLKPPSPYKIVDTKEVASKHFNFPSNSLEYLCDVFNVKHKKKSHKKFPGFELWLECLRNNNEAWDEMKEYNIADIYALEDIYLRMRPWVSNHPNVSIFDVEEQKASTCPKCNSPHIHWRGYAHTNLGRYARFQCQDCGGWGRGRQMLLEPNDRKVLMTNAS